MQAETTKRLQPLGADMPEGIIMSARHHNNWPETPANKTYVEKFYKAAGRYPSYAAEGAYVGIHMIAEAIRKVGNANDTEALVKAMEGMKIQCPEDPQDLPPISIQRPIRSFRSRP